MLLVRAQTSYETVLKDASVFLGITNWAVMIVDEAHRFKSVTGATRQKVVDMHVRWKLLLTGARPSAFRLCLGFGGTVLLAPVCWSVAHQGVNHFNSGHSWWCRRSTAATLHFYGHKR